MQKLTRWRRATIAAGLLAALLAACSFILDKNDEQCKTREDCVEKGFTGTPVCEEGVCKATNLGPEGCFLGTPTTPAEFANQCTAAQCEKFDNCARLGLCGPNAQLPEPITPPDASSSSTSDSSFPVQLCVEDPATTIVVTGATAVANFMQSVAPLVASAGYRLAYQPSGACNGVDGVFNPDPTKRVAKDRVGVTSLLFPADGGAGVKCTWGAGADIDVGVSDVFSTSCNPNYIPGPLIADFLGPIQPMIFVVPATSTQTVISKEQANIVFGRGSRDERSMPWSDPNLYFVRNNSSGTQTMLSMAIGLDPGKWWGKNSGGATGVVAGLTSVVPALADSVIGILSTDAIRSDDVRRNIHTLAFQDKNQLCGFYPDRIPVSKDKQNVRDGHYPIWGPIHFYAPITNGQPSAKASALVQRFTLPGIDKTLLDSIITSGIVPPCAMKVTRDTELGPLKPYNPPFQCGCYFESKVADNSVPPNCTPCTSTNDCSSDKPACNLGFCELR